MISIRHSILMLSSLVLLLLCAGCISQDVVQKGTSTMYHTFWDFQRACDRLPIKKLYDDQQYDTPLTSVEFVEVLERFFQTMQFSSLADPTRWVDAQKPEPEFFDNNRSVFQPYVQKLEVASSDIIAFHGDLHGDIHSLHRYITTLVKEGYLDTNDPFKIVDPHFYMIFLGDYTDRGWYGAEVLYTIFRLKIANPDRVYMVRGNHEDRALNSRYGFSYEMEMKFHHHAQPLLETIYRTYNYLPVALYCGTGTQEQKTFYSAVMVALNSGFNRSRCCNINNRRRIHGLVPCIVRKQLDNYQPMYNRL